jgi:alpha-N-arabinofuranosidase
MSAAGLPPPQPWPEPAARDDFTAPRLGHDWNFIRNPVPGSWSLTERPGYLRLVGSRTSLDDEASPAFIGRRQRHFRSTARARLEFSPDADGQQAGLTVRANEQNHYDLVRTRSRGEALVQLWTRTAGTRELANEIKVSDGPLELGIEAHSDHYGFFAVDADGHRHALGRAPTRTLSTESAGGFTGVYFGMFAWAGDGARTPPADFDWFEYRGQPGA